MKGKMNFSLYISIIIIIYYNKCRLALPSVQARQSRLFSFVVTRWWNELPSTTRANYMKIYFSLFDITMVWWPIYPKALLHNLTVWSVKSPSLYRKHFYIISLCGLSYLPLIQKALLHNPTVWSVISLPQWPEILYTVTRDPIPSDQRAYSPHPVTRDNCFIQCLHFLEGAHTIVSSLAVSFPLIQ